MPISSGRILKSHRRLRPGHWDRSHPCDSLVKPRRGLSAVGRFQTGRGGHPPSQQQLEPGIVAAVSPSPPPKQLVATAESNVSRPDAAARRERAWQVAKDFLQSKGFHVESSPAPTSFDLLCSKGSQHFRVEIQVPAEGQTALRFTRQQIETATRADPADGVIGGRRTRRAGFNWICRTRAERSMQFVENWKPVQQKLVPVVFEYPLH